MDLIGALSSQLGVDDNKAKAVAGTLLGAVRSQVDGDMAETIDRSIPELSSWVQQADAEARRDEPEAPAVEGGLSGLLGGLTGGGGGGLLGAAAGMLGGREAQDIVKVGTMIQAVGVPADKATMAAPLVTKFIRERLGDGMFDKLLSAAPLLGALTGSDTAPSGGLGGAIGGLFG